MAGCILIGMWTRYIKHLNQQLAYWNLTTYHFKRSLKFAILYGGYTADIRRTYGVDMSDKRRTYGRYMADGRWTYGEHTENIRQTYGGHTANIRRTHGDYTSKIVADIRHENTMAHDARMYMHALKGYHVTRNKFIYSEIKEVTIIISFHIQPPSQR